MPAAAPGVLGAPPSQARVAARVQGYGPTVAPVHAGRRPEPARLPHNTEHGAAPVAVAAPSIQPPPLVQPRAAPLPQHHGNPDGQALPSTLLAAPAAAASPQVLPPAPSGGPSRILEQLRRAAAEEAAAAAAAVAAQAANLPDIPAANPPTVVPTAASIQQPPQQQAPQSAVLPPQPAAESELVERGQGALPSMPSQHQSGPATPATPAELAPQREASADALLEPVCKQDSAPAVAPGSMRQLEQGVSNGYMPQVLLDTGTSFATGSLGSGGSHPDGAPSPEQQQQQQLQQPQPPRPQHGPAMMTTGGTAEQETAVLPAAQRDAPAAAAAQAPERGADCLAPSSTSASEGDLSALPMLSARQREPGWQSRDPLLTYIATNLSGNRSRAAHAAPAEPQPEAQQPPPEAAHCQPPPLRAASVLSSAGGSGESSLSPRSTRSFNARSCAIDFADLVIEQPIGEGSFGKAREGEGGGGMQPRAAAAIRPRPPAVRRLAPPASPHSRPSHPPAVRRCTWRSGTRRRWR